MELISPMSPIRPISPKHFRVQNLLKECNKRRCSQEHTPLAELTDFGE